MKSGYYTDKQGNVLGYWELTEKPGDTDIYTWVESAERPAIAKTPEQIAAEQKAADKLRSRYLWENYYIEQCRALGLPDVATTEQIQGALEAQSDAAVAAGNIVGAMNALKKGVEMLGIINAITQNGGSWEGITYHPEVSE